VVLTGAGYVPVGTAHGPGGAADPVTPAALTEAHVVLAGGALASDATLAEVDGGWAVTGDPTEAAFVVAERKLHLSEDRERRFTRTGELPFSSERARMSVVATDAELEGGRVLVTKGAPDVLLPRCTHLRTGSDVEPLDEPRRARLRADVETMSSRSLRTLAVAYRVLADHEDPGATTETDPERDLVWVGTAGMLDPPRDEAVAAIDEAHGAGIRVLMITGDHPTTALHIARDLGIVGTDDDHVVTGTQLDELGDDEWAEVVRTTSVFARVAPAHKLRIVTALQAQGEVVAMTGDGVNDAPALKAADIGVAMGRSGTSVSREAAAMILADDDVATIVVAVREGRVIFENIRKFLRYLLSSNFGEVLTVFGGVVLAGVLGLRDASAETIVLPLLATQILWVNLVTDAAPALAMGVDPGDDDVMSRPPRGPHDRVIDARMWVGVVVVGLAVAASTLLTLDVFLPGGLVDGSDSLEVARTAGFTTLVLAQLLNAFNSRSETRSVASGLFANRWLWAAAALGLALQLLVVELPWLQAAFGTASLDVEHWLVCLALASSVVWVDEGRKLVLRARDRRRGDAS
jgi:magnesium-transporting ATPase (P-type)